MQSKIDQIQSNFIKRLADACKYSKNEISRVVHRKDLDMIPSMLSTKIFEDGQLSPVIAKNYFL